MADTTGGRDELLGLTGLRAVASLHVLVFHALFVFSHASMRLAGSPAVALLSAGYVSLDLLFVLSGFVMAYAYVDQGGMAVPVTHYFRARFARIYPMHLLALLAVLPLFVLGSLARHAPGVAVTKEAALEFLITASLAQAWVPGHAFDLNGPAWSLSVEAFFYACFPLLAGLLAPRRSFTLVLVVLVAWLASIGASFVHAASAGTMGGADGPEAALLVYPVVRLPDFAMGVCMGLLFLRSPAEARQRYAPWLAATTVAVIAIVVQWGALPPALLRNGLAPLLGLLIFAIASSKGRAGLGCAPLVSCGRASYSLYILQKPIYLWFARLTGTRGVLPPSHFLAEYAILSVVIALLAHWLLEEPARRWLRGTWRDRKKLRPAALA